MNTNTTNTPVSYPTPEEINPFHQIPDNTQQPHKETNPFHQISENSQLSEKETNPFLINTATETNPFHQPSNPGPQQPQPETEAPKSTSSEPQQPQPETKVPEPTPATSSEKSQEKQAQDLADAPSCSSSQPPAAADESPEKWGTHVMGHPAVPTCHPANKNAALWGAPSDQAQQVPYPYLQYSPVEKSSNRPMESMLHVFNSWSNKAESLANNIWHNLKTGSSVSGAAWGKMNLTAKALSGGGYESLYKQTFATYPNEKLKKTFACYLSTSTGPVAGTIYLSNIHVAFCSDRPLSFTAPSGQQSWSYYKIMVPLGNIATINPVVMRENPLEKYIQIVTIDGQDFWYMGFVNYEKASRHLTESISTFVASGYAIQPVVAKQKE